MNRLATIFVCLSVTALACSGAPEKSDQSAVDGSDAVSDMSEPGLVEACQNAATEATALVQSLENSPASDVSFSDYRRMVSAHAKWNAENHPCTAEGPEVTERAKTAASTKKKLDVAQEVYVSSKVQELVDAGKLDAARELLVLRFSQGRRVSSELQSASYAMSNAYGELLKKAFASSGQSAQFEDDLETTCIFSRTEFDPQNKPVEDHHASVFGGKGTVYALCRLPLPAEKYAGDPNGEVKLVIDTDDDDSNGVLSETSLGKIAKYKQSRYFRGRFPVPQGIGTDELSAYFHVRIKLERPEMGNETPVGNGFWWFSDQ